MPTLTLRSRLVAALAATLLTALLAVVPAPLAAQGVRADLVVTPEWLAARLDDPRLVVLHVAHDDDYEAGHVPGARRVTYGTLVTRRGTVGSELPDLDSLRAAFEALGVGDSSFVVVYSHEAPMATRVLFSLAALGHDRFAFLDGGLERWTAERRPVSKDAPRPDRGRLTARRAAPVTVDAEWLSSQVNGGPAAGLALIDTRTTGEYNGTGNRSGMPSAGHLAGARQLEWQEMFADGMTRLKPLDELQGMFAERVAPGDTVVTYCWVGYRASATWFMARYLGYEARLYDGSYQDWSQRGLPTRAGTTP
jgi:thiosulfate/3-mercaptopyruvate sulfurtransferase